MKPSALSRLVDRAALPYRQAGRFAWHHARGKLARDPFFAALLRFGLVPPGARILDLGCGQGLLAAWLAAACTQYAAGDWPAWPAPSCPVNITGIELRERDVARAQAALGSTARVTQGDICQVPFGTADLIVILDVLHYLDYASQDAVLTKVRAAMAPGGKLLLRVSDADGGLAFRLGVLVDRMVMRARRYAATSVYCRSLSDWRTALGELGFEVETLPMSTGTPFANVLLVCRV